MGAVVLRGAGAWVLALAFARLAFLPPMQCDGRLDGPALDAAAGEAVAWLVRTQESDGTYLYRYDAQADADLGGYNLTRHAGVTMSLYQAATNGYDGALDAADRGTGWALARARTTPGDGLAFAQGDGRVGVGQTALLAAGLAERRTATGDARYDRSLLAMGRFLAGQVDHRGRLLAYWDPATEQPVPRETSRFFTGEAWWALARLHALFPEEGFDAASAAVARYVVEDRDTEDTGFPPRSDHWAAYAVAATAGWPEAPSLARLGDPDAVERWARRQLGLLGVEARFESQQTLDGLNRRLRGPHSLTAGVATVGEGLWGWAATASRDPAVPGDRETIVARARCVAEVLVDRQVDAAEARTFTDPERVRGAWLTDGVTQMDDQQHALSVLLLAQRWRGERAGGT